MSDQVQALEEQWRARPDREARDRYVQALRDAGRGVEGDWVRIEAWCAARRPDAAEDLRPGASPEALAAAEAALGCQLPAEVRASFARHDGQAGAPLTGIVFNLQLLPLEEAVAEWREWKAVIEAWGPDHVPDHDPDCSSTPAGAIRETVFDPGWIPLTRDGSGNSLGVDLNPGPAGQVGQLIPFGRAELDKTLAFAGWGELLTFLADALESENVTLAPDGGLVHGEDPADAHFHAVLRDLGPRP